MGFCGLHGGKCIFVTANNWPRSGQLWSRLTPLLLGLWYIVRNGVNHELLGYTRDVGLVRIAGLIWGVVDAVFFGRGLRPSYKIKAAPTLSTLPPCRVLVMDSAWVAAYAPPTRARAVAAYAHHTRARAVAAYAPPTRARAVAAYAPPTRARAIAAFAAPTFLYGPL